MLFVAPEHHGLGVGKALVRFVVDQHGINVVDVNEQNPQAVGFYLSQGFVRVDRSALDGQGNPFPILHMQYQGGVA
jgi:putative acetyltransferase